MYKSLIQQASDAIKCLDRLMFNAVPLDPMFAGRAANLLDNIKAELETLEANPPKPEFGPGVKAVADTLRERFVEMPSGSKGEAEVFLNIADVAAMLAEVEAK